MGIKTEKTLRLKIITCQVFCREITAVARKSQNQVDVSILPMGLHEMPCTQMRDHLQAAIDEVDPAQFEAIALAYGFCNHGIVGLQSKQLPLIIPRAHDCISLLLGGRSRYEQQMEQFPGTYFRSSGWLEHRRQPSGITDHSIARKQGLYDSLSARTEQFGEEKAQFLQEQLGDLTRHYSRLAFIETGTEPNKKHELQAREEADRQGWRFEKLKGSLTILQQLIDGHWNSENFLVLQPDQSVGPAYNETLITQISS